MKKAKIIILAGQSNADGISHPEYLDIHFGEEKAKEYKQGFNKIKINYYSHTKKSNGFISVKADKTDEGIKTFGPEVSMAEVLSSKSDAEEYFIVKCALGCTSLHYDWNSPSCDAYHTTGLMSPALYNIFGQNFKRGWLYDELLNVVSSSIKIFEETGYKAEICAFCWMQGEADSCEISHAENYINRYDNLLKDLKNAFNGYIENCVYVDAAIAPIPSGRQYYEVINNAKRDYAEQHSNCRFVDTVAAGLTTLNEPIEEPDIHHYDADAMIKLGHMFVENI